MLKISQAGKTGQNFALKLEGRIIGPWVAELRLICETLLEHDRTMKLDLADVSFADTEGVALLTKLKSSGVMLVNSSPFVSEQLKPGNNG